MKPRRQLRLLAPSRALVLAGMSLSACTEVETATVEGYEPAHLTEIKGSDLKLVEFTEEGAARTQLETATVRRSGARTVLPYAALIYDGAGKSYVYTSPKPLTFQRAEVKVDRVDGDRALLSTGPPAGSEVVTVGATEVYGAELEIAGSH